MNCHEARRLLDQGTRPGELSALQTRLGRHISQCSACRTYMNQQNRIRQRAPDLPAPAHKMRHLRQWLGVGVGVVMLLALVWTASMLLRTQRNVAAWSVTPAPTIDLTQAAATPTPTARQNVSGSIMGTASDFIAGQRSAPVPTFTPWPTSYPLPTATATPWVPVAERPVNILLLGNDQRPGRPDRQYTDAMMLVRVEPQQNRVAMLSIPRDLWVTIPGFLPDRINKAYILGEANGVPGSGMELSRATVSILLDVPVDYVVMVDFQGFISLIDALEGIEVEVQEELYDPLFPTIDYGYTVAHFVPGVQHMDGQTALMYSRVRHPDSDFSRIQRQQDIVVGIAARLRERGDLQNFVALDQITGSLNGYIRTDMPQELILSLAWTMRDYDLDAVEHYAITNDMVTWGVGDDVYALVPQQHKINQLARLFIEGS